MTIEEKLKVLNRISFRGPLGLFVIVAGFGFLFLLCFRSVPKENQELLTIAMGFVLFIMKDVASWYFGSSKDKADADKAEQVKSLISTAEKNEPLQQTQ